MYQVMLYHLSISYRIRIYIFSNDLKGFLLGDWREIHDGMKIIVLYIVIGRRFIYFLMILTLLGIVSIYLIIIQGLDTGGQNIDFQNPFSTIYTNKVWNPKGGPLSGIGSDPCRYFRYLIALQRIVDFQQVKQIVEIGFGDFQMNQHIIFEGKNYQGFDVVDFLIQKSEGNEKFNIIKDLKQIKNSGDLLIIKDVMQHWPNSAVHYLLEQILPRFRYALITNDLIEGNNRPQIPPGGWAAIPRMWLPATIEVVSLYEVYYHVTKRSFLYTNPNFKKT